MVTRYVFDEVKRSQKRSGKCAGCGNRTTRTTSVYQTINPFNRNALGLPKTREEIGDELRASLAVEVAKPLLCTACEYEAPPGVEPRGEEKPHG